MFRWPISVYYEDTDAGGVVYHSNYLNFFERARSEWLKAIHVKQTELLQQDTAFVVKHATLDFKRPAKFEQNLIVESSVIDMRKTSLTFEQQLLDEEGNCYCSGEIIVVCVALSRMRPKAIPMHIAKELKGGS
ncbi:tol-pal system-associated acyl-CoA thioesterase [Shewanella gelidii]|uniref:Tol-pal system-associated acyl-CoA thioesterase n=1 Tax=Shewanella gelidii TaxID=1642821 RepID=A0A917NA56_9GAMM|nr:tol-pal system-associated acyl-CoA thioesterase [Shewanella gelidii]MCL1099272.1 tol-pal system-associated acyl-CoA thioesterase [Shewanella gelidii]GGI76991.1 tol-pal system-associated acyl-CoA thioesterase [Shewanella gelidii]